MPEPAPTGRARGPATCPPGRGLGACATGARSTPVRRPGRRGTPAGALPTSAARHREGAGSRTAHGLGRRADVRGGRRAGCAGYGMRDAGSRVRRTGEPRGGWPRGRWPRGAGCAGAAPPDAPAPAGPAEGTGSPSARDGSPEPPTGRAQGLFRRATGATGGAAAAAPRRRQDAAPGPLAPEAPTGSHGEGTAAHRGHRSRRASPRVAEPNRGHPGPRTALAKPPRATQAPCRPRLRAAAGPGPAGTPGITGPRPGFTGGPVEVGAPGADLDQASRAQPCRRSRRHAPQARAGRRRRPRTRGPPTAVP